MKIVAASIDWHLDYANDPTLNVIFDEKREEIFEAFPHGNCTYYKSERDGLAEFWLHNPSDHAGFGGRTFNLKMLDGSTVSIKGPWHGGADHFNSQRPVAKHLIDVRFNYAPAMRPAYFGYWLTIERIQKEVLPLLPNVAIARIRLHKHDYYTFVLLNKDHDCIPVRPLESDNKTSCSICKHKIYSTITLI